VHVRQRDAAFKAWKTRRRLEWKAKAKARAQKRAAGKAAKAVAERQQFPLENDRYPVEQANEVVNAKIASASIRREYAEAGIKQRDSAIEIVDAEIIRNHIKDACKERQIAQKELARRVGVSYRHLNRIALDESEPSMLLAVKICTVLKKRIERVFHVRVRSRRIVRGPELKRRRIVDSLRD
jgi:DNA-binding XRE family transcriptional regulator